MGAIGEDFGPISVENRRESFIIHAGYGYGPLKAKVSEIGFGNQFTFDKRVWKVTLVAEDRIEAREEQFSTIRTWYAPEHPDYKSGSGTSTEVEVYPSDSVDVEHDLGDLWKSNPHPEFAMEDLTNLISALADAGSRRGVTDDALLDAIRAGAGTP